MEHPVVPLQRDRHPGLLEPARVRLALIAQRIERYARIVGKDRVIASTDGGDLLDQGKACVVGNRIATGKQQARIELDFHP